MTEPTSTTFSASKIFLYLIGLPIIGTILAYTIKWALGSERTNPQQQAKLLISMIIGSVLFGGLIIYILHAYFDCFDLKSYWDIALSGIVFAFSSLISVPIFKAFRMITADDIYKAIKNKFIK